MSFVTDKVICLAYFDDCLFFLRKQDDIDELLQKIKNEGEVFNVKNEAVGFLSVAITFNKKDNTNCKQSWS